MARKKKIERFEDALDKLEKIVEQLEQAEIPLEEALESFTEGVQLARLCHKKLEEADKKIELLVQQQGEDWDTVPFATGDAEEPED